MEELLDKTFRSVHTVSVAFRSKIYPEGTASSDVIWLLKAARTNLSFDLFQSHRVLMQPNTIVIDDVTLLLASP